MSLNPDDHHQNPLAWQQISLYERQLHNLDTLSNRLQQINDFIRLLRPHRTRRLTMTSLMNIAQRDENVFSMYFTLSSFVMQWMTNNIGIFNQQERRVAELHARELALSVVDFFRDRMFTTII
jgi:hypothetical protein